MINDDDLGLHNEPAERALIAGVARQPDALAGILAELPGDRFWSPPRGVVWDACREMSTEGELIHPVAVGRWLVKHGKWDAKSLSGNVAHVVNIEMAQGDPLSYLDARRHAASVREFYLRRRLVEAASRAQRLAITHPGDTSEALAAARAEFEDVDASQDGTSRRGPMRWDALLDEFEQAHTSGVGAIVGTPWPDLNAFIGGLFPGRQYVLGARPGQGKSTVALNMAMHAARQGVQSLVISREMPSLDITGRILASEAMVPLEEINTRNISDLSWKKIRTYLDQAGRPAIVVDDTVTSIAQIRALARAHHHRHGLGLLIVDYLQLVDEKSDNRQEQVAAVSRKLKALAMELEIATILPSQLNRESTKRSDSRPTMADLRDSGGIEQDADAVILLWQPPDEECRGEIDLILDKNRHGRKGTIGAIFNGEWGLVSGAGQRWTG